VFEAGQPVGGPRRAAAFSKQLRLRQIKPNGNPDLTTADFTGEVGGA
jgi:hypothetical protein